MTRAERMREAFQLNEIAYKMHLRGWVVDEPVRQAHSQRLAGLIDQARERFAQVAGVQLTEADAEGEDDDEFDERLLGSSKQLQALFYGRWGVPQRVSPKTGQPTLDRQVLGDLLADSNEKVAQAARWLLRYREAHKTKSTYIDRLAADSRSKANKPNSYLTRGWPEPGEYRLRPSWHPIHAVTGRWSSSGPNLQNLQKPVLGKDAEGKKIVVRPGTRDVLIARPRLWVVEGDWSQLELRIIALLSGDDLLLSLYEEDAKLRREGKAIDIHAENAKTLFELTHYDPEAHKALRGLAKIFVFGSNYGGGAKTVWRQIVAQYPQITLAEVEGMRARWFQAHPAVSAWTQQRFDLAKTTGMIREVLSGREFMFYLGKVKRTEPGNYTVQGFAAALMNRVMPAVDRALSWDDGEAILAQVHDALFLEGPHHPRLCKILQDSMVTEITLNGRTMQFPIDLKVGRAWGTMEDVA